MTPLLAEAVHARLIRLLPTAVAVKPDGAAGGVGFEAGVVAEAVFE